MKMIVKLSLILYTRKATPEEEKVEYFPAKAKTNKHTNKQAKISPKTPSLDHS